MSRKSRHQVGAGRAAFNILHCVVWQAAGAVVGGGHGFGRGCGLTVVAADTQDVGRGKPAPMTGGGVSPLPKCLPRSSRRPRGGCGGWHARCGPFGFWCLWSI